MDKTPGWNHEMEVRQIVLAVMSAHGDIEIYFT